VSDRSAFQAHLAYRLKERQRLESPTVAADFDDRHFGGVLVPSPAPWRMKALISSVMCGNHLPVRPEVFAAALLL